MIRIHVQTVAAGVKRYFAEALARDDYYQHGAERPGLWRGQGAALLGLDGPVASEPFSRLTENRHPKTGEPLTPRTKDNRRVGYDISFHAPKSVSVVFAATRDPDILAAFTDAVGKTMSELEAAMHVRVRTGGQSHDRPTGNMVWAEYLHMTARPVAGEPDPHIHIHNFAFNASFDPEEQRWKAGQFGELKRSADYYEDIFHSHLALNLDRLGYPVRPTETAFEIEGVPEPLRREFSQRTQLIESLAAELGVQTAAGKAALGAKTRERKGDDVDLDTLHARWADRIDDETFQHLHTLRERRTPESSPTPGASPTDRPASAPEADPFSPEPETPAPNTAPVAAPVTASVTSPVAAPVSAPEARRGVTDGTVHNENGSMKPKEPERPSVLAKLVSAYAADTAVRIAAEDLFQRDAIISERRLQQRAMQLSRGKASPEEIRRSAERLTGLVRRVIDGVTFLTTKEAIAEERFIVDFARSTRGTMRALGTEPTGLSTQGLDDRDRTVLGELLASRDRITLFKCSGPTRKPELIKAALAGIDRAGYKTIVVGANPAAARQAEQEYGRKDVASLPQLLQSDTARQELKAKLSTRVLWVEEAGRLGSRTAAELLRLVKNTKCRIVLAGDERRSRVYERGDAFRLLRQDAGLTTAERRVVRDGATGLEQIAASVRDRWGSDASAKLAEQGKLHIAETEQATIEAAAKYWQSKATSAKKRVLVVCPSERLADRFTETLRALLRAAGTLRGKERTAFQLRPAGVSELDKRRAEHYRKGMVIEFHKPTRGFKSGDRTKVVGTDALGGVYVSPRVPSPIPVRLKLGHADRFSVWEAGTAKIAVGDRIRITKNARLPVGGLIRNSSSRRVRAILPAGDIVLDNLKVLPRAFGHFEHDYAATNHRVQGRRLDAVGMLVSTLDQKDGQRVDAVAAVDAAKGDFAVFTDSRTAFEETVDRNPNRLAATDLTERPERLADEIELHRRLQNEPETQPPTQTPRHRHGP